ncbi:hypothetical protein C8J56DRAFT_927478 [Mycena floridula]|nr:hypothetical protein C8J56DRAFT_927478 [Mycena floridula]
MSYELSTTQINRLLRPLRTKCKALLGLDQKLKAMSTPSTTYSSTAPTTWSSSQPPLSIIPRHDGSSLSIQFNKDLIDLSKKIYAVRDALKDIIVKTERRRCSEPAAESRIPSLAAITAAAIGNLLEPKGEEEEVGEIEEDTDLVSPIYEEIPVQYRRWTLISHAFFIVLNASYHHPTLLSILLNVALEHGLMESETILRALLVVSMSPNSALIPPICHAVHSGFLTDLHERWTSAGRPVGTFISILCDVLEEVQCSHAWSCKALCRLFSDRGGPELSALTNLASSLVHFLADGGRRLEQSMTLAINKQVQLWLHSNFTLLRLSDGTSTVWQPVLSFLETCRVHSSTNLNVDLQAAVISVATELLRSFHAPLSDRELANVLQLLDLKPSTSSYNFFIASTFGAVTGAETLVECKAQVAQCAKLLRTFGLEQLEASLWACALRHVDTGSLAICGASKVEEYRRELMALVEDAEQRCFGSASDISYLPSPIPKPIPRLLRPSAVPRAIRSRPSLPAAPLSILNRETRTAPPMPEVTRCHKKQRRTASILSVAFSQRDVLHPPKKSTKIPPVPKFDDSESDPENDIPSSEDCLNLFAS